MKHIQLDHTPTEPVSHNLAIQKQVMLRMGDLPHLTNFSQARFAPGQVAPAHAHADMCEVFFVQCGSGEIEVNQQTYPLTAGTCIAVERGEVHEIRNTGSEELVLTYFGLRVTPA